jgi:hypothetical protein
MIASLITCLPVSREACEFAVRRFLRGSSFPILSQAAQNYSGNGFPAVSGMNQGTISPITNTLLMISAA